MKSLTRVAAGSREPLHDWAGLVPTQLAWQERFHRLALPACGGMATRLRLRMIGI
jgi:hypothetical protein